MKKGKETEGEGSGTLLKGYILWDGRYFWFFKNFGISLIEEIEMLHYHFRRIDKVPDSKRHLLFNTYYSIAIQLI